MKRITLPRPDWILRHRSIHRVLHATLCQMPFVQESGGTGLQSTFLFILSDSTTSARIAGAGIVLRVANGASGSGVSNSAGVIEITINSPVNTTASISASAVGYNSISETLNLKANTPTFITMTPGTGPPPSSLFEVPTWVVDVSDKTTALSNTMVSIEINPVHCAGNKQYNHWTLNPALTQKIPMAAGDQVLNSYAMVTPTTNIYWGAFLNGRNVGTVGQDIQLGTDGNLDFNQWIDPVNPQQTGFPHSTNTYHFGAPKAPIGNASWYNDSGGEERQSCYCVLNYMIVGGHAIKRASGTWDAVIWVNKTLPHPGGGGGTGFYSLPLNQFSFQWIMRAPPSWSPLRDSTAGNATAAGCNNNTINSPDSGNTAMIRNYLAFQTTGISFDNQGGPNPLRLKNAISMTQGDPY